MTWQEFDRKFALSEADFVEKREQLMAAAEICPFVSRQLHSRWERHVCLRDEAEWWMKFEEALGWAIKAFRAEVDEDGDELYLPFDEMATVQHWRKQRELADQYASFGQSMVRRMYGQKG